MAASALGCNTLDGFRSVWVRGRLDYQRAVDALEEATHSEEQTRAATGGAAVDDEVTRLAHKTAEEARQRLAEVEAALARQFNEFCGVSK